MTDAERRTVALLVAARVEQGLEPHVTDPRTLAAALVLLTTTRNES
jgi:hypothetical protein